MTNSHKKLGDSNGLYFEPALPPAWNLLQVPALLSVTPGWRGLCVRFPTLLILRLVPRALRMNSARADRLGGRCVGVRGYGETTMDYDWLWVILAVGVLGPVGVSPFALARDACC